MNLLGYLLGLEKSNLETISKHWGAGYEMIYFEGGKFKKVNNLTFWFITGDIDKDANTRHFRTLFIYNTIYKNELLLLNVININEQREASFIVRPINLDENDINKDELPPVGEVNSEHICLIYIPKFSPGQTKVSTFFLPGRPEGSELEPFAKVVNNKTCGLQMSISKTIQDQIWDYIGDVKNM